MRRLVLLLALAAVFAPAAVALPGDTGDGTLSMRNGRGLVVLDVRGVVIGQIDSGRIVVTDPNSDDGLKIVRGAESKTAISDTRTRWRGEDMRIRLIGGQWRVVIAGSGIDLSVVGRGKVRIDGRGEPTGLGRPGRYSLNDGSYEPLPTQPTTLDLSP